MMFFLTTRLSPFLIKNLSLIFLINFGSQVLLEEKGISQELPKILKKEERIRDLRYRFTYRKHILFKKSIGPLDH